MILFIQISAIIYSHAGTVDIQYYNIRPFYNNFCPGDTVNFIFGGNLLGYTSTSENVNFQIDYGDGIINNYSTTVTGGIDSLIFNGYFEHIYTTVGSYTPTITVSVISDGANSSLTLITPFNVLGTCITLSGMTYKDCNLNCAYDVGEEFETYVQITDNASYYGVGWTNLSGFYSKLVPPATYSLVFGSTMCNPSGSITGINTTSINNIPYNCSINTVYTDFFNRDSSTNCTNETLDFYFRINSYSTLYPSGTIVNVEINFGDGTITTIPVSLSSTGTPSFFGNISHIYLTSGTYTPFIKFTMPDGKIAVNNTHSVNIINTCDEVSGYLYNDANGNCVKDVGESPKVNYPVYISGGGRSYYDYTDINGFYSFNVPTGIAYNLSVSTYSYCSSGTTVSCPSSGSVSFTLSSSYYQNFAFTGITSFDASVYFYNISPRSYIRTDENSSGRIGYNVASTTPISGTVSMTLDPLTVFVSSVPTPTSISGSMITWNYSGLSTTSRMQFIDVTFHTSPLADTFNPMDSTGDIICLDFDITPTIGDCYLPNNHHHRCIPVGMSWDPNNKEVSPQGAGPEGIIAPGTDLTYTINFQNMGTSFARNVFVMDTLDPDLDINTFQLISNSHPVQVHWIEGNILKFAFDNIMLVDTSVSQDSSQGYFQYRIKHNATAPIGTEISNTASIYFDSNPAIVTNTTHNKLGEPNSIPNRNNESSTIKIYPNPAQEFVMIEIEGKELATIEVYNMLGKLIETKAIINHQEKLSIEKYNNGVYLINALNKTGQIVDTKKLNVIK